MADLALVVWILTALGGLSLAAIWLARGGLRQRDEALELSYAHVSEATRGGDRTPPERRSRLPAWMVTTHGALALLGLSLWAYYVSREGDNDAQVGALVPFDLALLVGVVTLGLLMVARWRADRKANAALPADTRPPKADRRAEQRIPAIAVYGHGLLAAVTVVLVALVTFGLD